MKDAFMSLSKKKKIIIIVVFGLLILGCLGNSIDENQSSENNTQPTTTTVETTTESNSNSNIKNDIEIEETKPTKTKEEKKIEKAAGTYRFTKGIVNGTTYSADELSDYDNTDWSRQYIKLKKDKTMVTYIQGQYGNVPYSFSNNYTEIEIPGVDEFNCFIDIKKGVIKLEYQEVTFIFEK